MQLVVWPLLLIASTATVSETVANLVGMFSVSTLLGHLFYTCGQERSFGQKCLGLRIVTPLGNSPSGLALALRSLSPFWLCLIPFFGFPFVFFGWMLALGSGRRGIHEWFTGTLVVDAQALEEYRQKQQAQPEIGISMV